MIRRQCACGSKSKAKAIPRKAQSNISMKTNPEQNIERMPQDLVDSIALKVDKQNTAGVDTDFTPIEGNSALVQQGHAKISRFRYLMTHMEPKAVSTKQRHKTLLGGFLPESTRHKS